MNGRKIPLGQETIDTIHMMSQEQEMPEVVGNFKYEDIPGQ